MRAAFRVRSRLLLATALLFAGLSGCTTLTGKSLGQNIDDDKTTGQVKTKLAEAEWRSLTRIGVHTTDGVVYLNGNVADEATRRQVEALARSVPGVREVVSQLRVDPALGTPPVSASPASVVDCPAAPAGAAPPVVTAVTQRVEGTIRDLDLAGRRLQVGAVPLELAPDAAILVNCTPANAGSLREGARVKAAYEVRDGRNVATVIEAEPVR